MKKNEQTYLNLPLDPRTHSIAQFCMRLHEQEGIPMSGSYNSAIAITARAKNITQGEVSACLHRAKRHKAKYNAVVVASPEAVKTKKLSKHATYHRCAYTNLMKLVNEWRDQTGSKPTVNTVFELIEWSARQAVKPDHRHP